MDPLGSTLLDLETWAVAHGLPRYRGRQIFDRIHRLLSPDYADARELPAALRDRLAAELPPRRPEIVRRDRAADGSVKFGLRLADGALIEAVYMPGDARTSLANEFTDARAAGREAEGGRREAGSTPAAEKFTVCLSSQTGCAVDCAFCVTGRLGGGRNLTAGEILGQLYAVLADAGRSHEGLRVVFMGMGEPLLNPDGVVLALEILFETLPPRRVTVSTSGITPALARLAALPRRPNLAVSLNAADEATRTRLMPITRTYPLPGLIAAMRAWPLEPRRRILVEYVLIAGVNDSPDDASRLARLLRGIEAKVNVIPLNEDPTYLPEWKRPSEAVIDRFVKTLVDARWPVTVRRSRGPDASAACGQLKGRLQDPRRARMWPRGTRP
ncbi:MAG TPA: 23S rRNA (adenine(2503)-C(2))-methyltransferase RlmN [Thermoanaerobaculia bacterium]|jgi:23S rRNA (adenine2503-C2)-methyltransferase